MHSSDDQQKAVRSLLDDLLNEARLYHRSPEYRELLDFVVRLPQFAPFNAMLLQVQKPGLMYAASKRDWQTRFGRTVNRGARPLLILWPFGPVALVYDVEDTARDKLPEDVQTFFTRGSIEQEQLDDFRYRLSRKDIWWFEVDAGDGRAGEVRRVWQTSGEKARASYELSINKNHPAQVQFATLVHELGHVFLGHLGLDKGLGAPERKTLAHMQRELEAESVAYIVCGRQGVTPKSQRYLAPFLQSDMPLPRLDVYQIMRAAGHVERLLGLQADGPTWPDPEQEGEQVSLFETP